LTAYRFCIRPLLFRFDAEWIHQATLRAGARLAPAQSALHKLFAFHDARLRIAAFGLEFPNPLGLGAGFDKNGTAVEALAATGFGFIEVGSVSAHPSRGNPVRPRLFRLPKDEALLVYYGVPNDGASAVARRLERVQIPVPLGVSLVETNTGRPAQLDDIIAELVAAARAFAEIADFLVLNLQCPNTEAGAGPLDDPAKLALLLDGLQSVARLPPVLLKVAAPKTSRDIDAVIGAVAPYASVKGFILSTLARKPYAGLRTPASELEGRPGSLTGAPLKHLAREAVSAWYSRVDRSRHVLIGVGGVSTGEDAYALIRRGASLVQLATALVYHGPGLVGRITRELCALLERDGIARIADAVGTDHR